MQGARSVLAVTAVLAFSCASRPPTPPVSTDDRDGVAGHDDEPAVPVGPIGRTGNLRIRSFDEAKKLLVRIYDAAPVKNDLYCGCPFFPEPGRGLRIDLSSCGYRAARDPERAARIEWEHAVPASAFGKTFVEWREGADVCVDREGKKYKGRKCARRSAEFARMEGDLHNLFPVVGEVNGLRSDLPMGLVDPSRRPSREEFHFGACKSAIESGVFQPRPEVRGDLARAYRYMDASYPERHLLDEEHRALFERWDAADPPDAWERERNTRIASMQGNANPYIPAPP